MPYIQPLPRRLLPVLLALALVTALLPAARAAAQTPDVAVDRLAGEDRIGTAVSVSQDTFDAADAVVLARADVYADALAGAPLAASLGAPLLLVPQTDVPGPVLAEIERLGASGASVLGGPAAISDRVITQLEDAGLTVTRVGGANRFETAARIAETLAADAEVSTVFLVEGADPDPNRGWPDAVSVSWYAAFRQAPVLLATTETLPQATMDALATYAGAEVVIVGGPVAVSTQIETELAGGRSLRRLAGADRYETSGLVYDEALAFGASPAQRWLATGRTFADALAAGPAVAAIAQALLLVDGQGSGLHAAVEARLPGLPELLARVVVLGGERAIPAQQLASLRAALELELPDVPFCLTVLHNNDGESALLGDGSYGGSARFATLVQREQALALSDRGARCDEHGVLTVTSGDNFLAGPEFQASLDKGVPYYDSIALDYVGYDALALGNHDFDFGPEVTADFIRGFAGGDETFLSANLDFSGSAALAPLAQSGLLAASTVVSTGGRDIGVIGAITPALRSISSPGDVQVLDDVVGIVNAEAEALEAAGADIIVLISHLQGLSQDLEVIPELSGVDVVVAGGGDEVLGAPGNLYVPFDHLGIFGPYPLAATDADGRFVPVVTTAGEYQYLGRLVAHFGNDGALLDDAPYHPTLSRMVRVAGETLPDGVAQDPFIVTNVVEPIEDYVAGLQEEVIGASEVFLNAERPDIRVQETNLGSLMADSQRDVVIDRATEFGLDPDRPVVGIQNGGGVRASIDRGDITVFETFQTAPFPNFVGAFGEVSPRELLVILEHGYSAVERVDGRFAQISGMTVEVDLTRPAQEVADGEVVSEGDRVRSVTLEDGTEIVVDGEVVAGAPSVILSTINFTAAGGDGYPMPPLEEFVQFDVSYQQALRRYIEDDLAGVVRAAGYPEGGTGRLTITGAGG